MSDLLARTSGAPVGATGDSYPRGASAATRWRRVHPNVSSDAAGCPADGPGDRDDGDHGRRQPRGVRIVRFASPQGMSFGVLDGDGQVAQIEGHPFGQISFTGARCAQADVRLLSPILPSKVVASARTTPPTSRSWATSAPTEPLLFLKPSTSVIGPGDADPLPPVSTNVHHEVELAVVIGAAAPATSPPEQAAAGVFGYTVRQRRHRARHAAARRPVDPRQGLRHVLPARPVDRDRPRPRPTSAVEISCTVDGEPRQDGRTSPDDLRRRRPGRPTSPRS